MKRPLTAALALTAVSLLAAGDASADTRSWTAVKKVIGKGDRAVVGIDLAQLRSSIAFKAGVELFLAEAEEARQVMDAIKADCGIDVLTALSDLTFVFQGDGDDPLMAFGLDGVDEARVVSCMGTVAGKMTGNPAPKITGKKVGKVTEYSVKGEKKKLYAAWLAKDVLVFTEDANDKKRLDRRLTGKGLDANLKKLIASTSATAPFWFAANINEKEDGRTIVGGHGKFELAAGVFKGSGAMLMGKPAEAAGVATEGTEAIAEAKREAAENKAVELGKVLNTATITAKGSEVVIGVSVPDKDIKAAFEQFDKVF